MKSMLNFVLLIVLCAAMIVPFGGCGMTLDEAKGHREALATEIQIGDDLAASLAEERDAALLRAEKAEAALDEARAEAEQATAKMLGDRLADVNEYLAPQREVLAKWDERIANWDDSQPNDLGFLTDVGSTLLPFLPAPTQGPAVLVVGVAGVLGRLLNRSKALNSLAASTVKLANDHPEVATAIKAAGATLRSIQSSGARNAVDAAQGKTIKLPV